MAEAAPPRDPAISPPLLEVRDLRTHFPGEAGATRAVDGVSFSIARGEILGLVGESGCGKSLTALSILRLVPPPGRIAGGEILLDGEDLLGFPEEKMRAVRGGRIAMIFQEPMTSLNPVHRVGAQIAEAVLAHQRVSRREARSRAVALLERVGIPAAAKRAEDYPHRLSGGMRQRAMIAMALAARPALLIADEPTTALDVTIQAQILDLLRELQREMGMAILLITHNLALVAEAAARIAVMYASRIVEEGPAAEVLSRPLHPYTSGLLGALPRPGMAREARLAVIPGTVPDPQRFPAGCRFHPRCAVRIERCSAEEPPFEEHRPGHRARCLRIEGGRGPLAAEGGRSPIVAESGRSPIVAESGRSPTVAESGRSPTVAESG